jgi:transcriptional repressor NF-X1
MAQATATTMPTVPVATNAPAPAAPAPGNRPPRNRRRGRGPPRDSVEGGRNNQPLARDIDSSQTINQQASSLDGGAPPFVPASVAPANHPAQPKINHRPRAPPKRPKNPAPAAAPAGPTQPVPGPSQRRASLLRSTAPDIATRTHEDIAKGVYECAICTNEVSRNSKVWSCRTCWTVFHIGCIKRWSKNEGSAAPQGQADDGQLPPPKQWRCPGCNLPQDTLPSAYSCWCEKELDPKPIPGIPPHSCGQTCGRERTFPKSCPHPCNLMCHAGPCPPCTHMGPPQSCFCAKDTTSRRCVDTNYESGWSCGQNCGDVMPCGKHSCPRPCHEGLCGACDADVEARCYCGKVNKVMKCHDLEEERESYNWVGEFDCHQTCDRPFDCGQHRCEKSCHPQDGSDTHCPRSPDVVTRCPCGKTKLSELSKLPRKSCTDPIPNCKQSCGKGLACGHSCEQICHTGNCLPCLRTVTIKCRCGRNEFRTICHQGSDEPPQCMRVCKVHLNCGRHECGERCCTGERKASDRQNMKRKMKSVTLDLARQIREEIEPEHICTRMCGRVLKCGNHTCQNLCHKGPCDSCKEAIFEDLSCSCGRTVLQAPLPCGTRPPPCTFPCNRPKNCGHPQTVHNCHSDDEKCPKCPFLTDKPCMCGKKTLKNQPCWRADVSCGLPCGRKLKCGSHLCQKLCHRAGDCEDAHTPCQQQCGKAKKTCGHPCEKPCHAPSACKEDTACPFKIMITCDCQRKKEEVRCNARAGTPNPPGRQSSLKCDDECARLERNRNLASALHISDSHTDDHVPYSTATLNMYLEDIKWAHTQEDILRKFAADPNERRLRFKPMKPHQRAFIHSIAEDFGFDGESMDPEPHKHVMLFKTPKFVAAPMKTLQQAARIKRAALNIGAPIHSVPSTYANGPVSRPPSPKQTWNGILLSEPRFGLTMSELQPYIIKVAPTALLDIYFLTSSDAIVLLPSESSSSRGEDATQVSALLESIESKLMAEVRKHNLAKEVVLGVFETSPVAEPRLIHRKGSAESNSSKVGAGGWSQVAAKGSAPVRAPQVQPVGQRPVYTVLGSRLAEAKKKKAEDEERVRVQKGKKGGKKGRQVEEIVDDWEVEVEKEDQANELEATLHGKHDVEPSTAAEGVGGDEATPITPDTT